MTTPDVKVAATNGVWFVWKDGVPLPFPYPDYKQAAAAAEMVKTGTAFTVVEVKPARLLCVHDGDTTAIGYAP